MMAAEKPKKPGKGKFIVVEGIDGSGKGTIIAMLRSYLLNRGIKAGDILVTAEPTEGIYGKKIRKILRAGRNPRERAAELLSLYLRDRREHVSRVILPSLARGMVVLCDRYKYSTIAYQSAQGLPKKELIRKQEGFPKPDLAIILDLPVRKGLMRVAADAGRQGRDVFEQQAFLGKVRQAFLSLKKELPRENIAVVDASGTREEVFAGVLKEAGKVL